LIRIQDQNQNGGSGSRFCLLVKRYRKTAQQGSVVNKAPSANITEATERITTADAMRFAYWHPTGRLPCCSQNQQRI